MANKLYNCSHTCARNVGGDILLVWAGGGIHFDALASSSIKLLPLHEVQMDQICLWLPLVLDRFLEGKAPHLEPAIASTCNN